MRKLKIKYIKGKFLYIFKMIGVTASFIDRTVFYYTCPICGDTHRHSNNNDFTNREEVRLSHCTKKGQTNMMSIIINNDTIRKGERPPF